MVSFWLRFIVALMSLPPHLRGQISLKYPLEMPSSCTLSWCRHSMLLHAFQSPSSEPSFILSVSGMSSNACLPHFSIKNTSDCHLPNSSLSDLDAEIWTMLSSAPTEQLPAGGPGALRSLESAFGIAMASTCASSLCCQNPTPFKMWCNSFSPWEALMARADPV